MIIIYIYIHYDHYIYIYITDLRAIRDRIPVGVRFPAPVHTDPGSHPASCTMGNGSLLRG